MRLRSSLRAALPLLAASLLSLAGSCPPRPPTPIPTPTPTPTPQGMLPLKVSGNQFSPPILGSITTHHGWPLVDAVALDAIAGSGLNYTAMRLPCELDDRPGYDIYMRSGDKADLSRFNPAFDALLAQTLAHAQNRGIYVNLGLVDGWCAIHIEELRSPLKAENNIQGVDLGSCAQFQQAPPPVIQAEVNHVVSVAAKFPNVIWELGNEANRCKPSPAFIDGIRTVVRTAEAAGAHPRHLWSPGTVEGGVLGAEFDFVSYHGNPEPLHTWPSEVNEFSPQGQAQYLANLAQAKQIGTVYHYWHDDNPNFVAIPVASGASSEERVRTPSAAPQRELSVENYRRATGKSASASASARGPWDDPAWEAEWLSTMKLMKAAPPTTGCTNIPNETAIAVVPRPQADPLIASAINAAIQRVKPACQVGSSCEILEGMQPFFARVTEEIRKGGPGNPPLCAGVQSDSEGLVDQICVGTEQRCQGNHIYTCNTGCVTGKVGWAPGSYTNRRGDTWILP